MVTSVIVMTIQLQSTRLGIALFQAINMAVPSYYGQIVQEDIMDSDVTEEHRFLQVICMRYFLTGSGEGRVGNFCFPGSNFWHEFSRYSVKRPDGSRNINRKSYILFINLFLNLEP